jgi:cholesterol transport system auxiliary component
MRRRGLIALLPATLVACSALPKKPANQTMYDFGPAPAAGPDATGERPALTLPDVEAEGLLETTALLYRLGYEDAFELRPYAYARWSAPPTRLVHQRLRDVLGRQRAVLDNSGAAALVRRGAERPPMLRVHLDAFFQLFDAPDKSRGIARLSCTVLQASGGGERLLGQRHFDTERPAPTPDAPGGVRALTAAVDAAAEDIARWLQQQQA